MKSLLLFSVFALGACVPLPTASDAGAGISPQGFARIQQILGAAAAVVREQQEENDELRREIARLIRSGKCA